MTRSYDECLNEMYGLRRFGIKLGLDVITGILSGLDNPHLSFSTIHIAGTNGKGSIASYLSSILHASGYRVGLYTSPHLIRFNERIQINGQEVSDNDVIEAWESVKNAYSGEREPTFFEYTTAMALYLFYKAGVEWAVVETGMGGRLDATNLLTPKLAIISNISLEHRFYLGNTIAEIAGEKAGIIKPKTPVICGATQPSAIQVIEKKAYECNAPVFRLKKDFRIRRQANDKFTYYGMDVRWPDMHTPLFGEHQKDNAALALAASEVLMKSGANLNPDSIRAGLESTKWPGRLEIIRHKPGVCPEIILDGAHNLDASRKIAKFLKTHARGREITLVIGILDDKPRKGILKALVPLCRRIIITEPEIDRAFPAERLLPEVLKMKKDARIISGVDNAVKYVLETTNSDQIICIAGSLYVVGEARRYLEALFNPRRTKNHNK